MNMGTSHDDTIPDRATVARGCLDLAAAIRQAALDFEAIADRVTQGASKADVKAMALGAYRKMVERGDAVVPLLDEAFGG